VRLFSATTVTWVSRTANCAICFSNSLDKRMGSNKTRQQKSGKGRLLGGPDKFERLVTQTCKTRASDFVYAEHFQPVGVLLDLVPE